MNEEYAIEQLLPHARPLLLLDRLSDSGEGYIECEVVVRSDGLFDTNGEVPGLVGIEYMAQAVSAYSGLSALRRGRPIRLGFLLGTRRFETNVAAFSCGTLLTVRVHCVMQSEDGMASFDCTVTGDGVLQKARISVFEPEDSASYLQQKLFTAKQRAAENV